MAQGIQIGDAVLKMFVDWTEIDQVGANLPAHLKPGTDAAVQLGQSFDGVGKSATAAGAQATQAADKATRSFTGFNDVVDKQRESWDGLTPKIVSANKAIGDSESAGRRAGQGLDVAKKGAEGADYSLTEARHTIMLLGEQMGIHIPRAVATMISSVGPLGGLLAAAFPVAAAVALVAIIGKVIEQHEKLKEQYRKAAFESENLKISEEERTTGLEVMNLRLEDALRKLEGRPATNQLAIALREVQSRADELATQFAKDFQSMDEEVGNLNGLMQKFSDYAANALKAYSSAGIFSLLAFSKEILSARGQETDAVKRVQNAESELEKARLASHEAATKDVASQQVALGQQATAAGNLQKAYDSLADAVAKVDPNNIDLVQKLRIRAKSAESDWKDLAQEIREVGLTAKETAEIQANEIAKRAEELAKIKIGGKQQLGILDAAAIQQAGAQAYAAETSAIKRIVEADVLAGQAREQVELDLVPRIAAAETALNNSKLAALEAGHIARIKALEAENADILKYEKGDAQVAALAENHNKQNAENRQYELDRQKIAADGEAKLNDIAAKGVGERIALQNALQKANAELVKADDQLLKSQTALSEVKITANFAQQIEAINQLSEFQLLNEQEKADRLKILYTQEERNALSALRDQLAQEKAIVQSRQNNVTAAENNPLFSKAQLAELKTLLDQAETSYTKTEAQIFSTQKEFEQKSLAQGKVYSAESVAQVIKAGQEQLRAEIAASRARSAAIDGEIKLAKARGEDTKALEQEKKATEAQTASLVKQDTAVGRLARGLDSLSVKAQHDLRNSGDAVKTFAAALNNTGSVAKAFGATMLDVYTQVEQAQQSAVASAILGQQSWGAALAEGTKTELANIAARDLVWGFYWLGRAIADSFWNPAAASAEFAAAGILLAQGAAAAAISYAIPGSGNSSTGSSAGSGNNTSPSSIGENGQASQQPVFVENVQHLGTGALVTGRTRAVIGDDPRGGDATEAVIPLDDERAKQGIANALFGNMVAAFSGFTPEKARTILPRESVADIVRPQPFARATLQVAREAGQVSREADAARSHQAPSQSPVVNHFERHEHNHTWNIEGIISDDKLDKVMKKMSDRVSSGKARLKSSTTYRVTKRG